MTMLAAVATHQNNLANQPENRILQRQCACGQHTQSGGECDECRKKRLKSGQSATVPTSGQQAPTIVNEVLNAPGRSLEPALRADLEPRFGRDFSQVRVHTGAKADESARAVNALAFTVGQDIVFRQGRYAPQTAAGRRLLAHELTHTIQQAQDAYSGFQAASALQINTPGDPYERQAEAVAARVAAGQSAAPAFGQIQPTASGLQRQADISQAPFSLLLGPCTLTAGPGHMAGTDVLFGVSTSTITAAQRPAITAFVRSWVAAGSRDNVIVDGWASTDGAQALNWQLSCDRAEAVKAELVTQGIPAGKITTFAHGESTEFSTSNLAQNRRAIITTQPVPGPPPPAPAPPGPGPAPAPPAAATITSETVLASPAPRNRTKIGVGEDVKLTHSAGSVTWVTTAGTLNSFTGATVILTAPDTAQTVVVTGGGARIAFEIVAPTGVHMDRAAGSVVNHRVGRPDSGILLDVFLLPDTVNFHNARYREIDVAGTATPGVYSCNPASGGHCGAGGGGNPCPDKALTATVSAGKGTKSLLGDCAISGDCCTAAPFAAGSLTLAIPYEYKVGTGAFHRFVTVMQVHSLAADGSTLTTSKGGASGSTTVAAGTSLIPTCPSGHC